MINFQKFIQKKGVLYQSDLENATELRLGVTIIAQSLHYLPK